MIAVSITVAAGPDTRTVEATVADTVPVAELIPHLVDAEPGELWRLTGPLGTVRPEHSLAEAAVRPGERLTLQRSGLPAPPLDDVGRLSGPVESSPAVWVAALVAAVVSWLIPGTLATGSVGMSAPVWHPLEVSDTARSLLDGEGGVPASALVAAVALLFATLGAATASLFDRRFVAVAAVLGFGLGLQVNVLCGCVLAALVVWRSGPERTVTVGLALAAAVNVVPGITVLLALVALTFSGQFAVGLAGLRLPRVPATGLFAALAKDGADDAGSADDPDSGAANRVLSLHPALVVTCCVVILAGAVQLVPPGSGASGIGWSSGALLVVAVSGLSARACRPVHAVSVTVMSTLLLIWVALHLPGAWVLLALLPAALPAVRITSPMAGRVLDVLETVSFAVAVPLLIATTGLFDLVRGIG
ncbi:MAG: EsaB/YukD family protein [Mycobacteriaceae bacterium]|uniref:EsaB/YukD family protein n=1 Tax=Corynebacterium sp. TaxID=1720 RepID=UPI003F9815B8